MLEFCVRQRTDFTARESALFDLLKAGFSYWTKPLKEDDNDVFETCMLADGKPCRPCAKIVDLDQLIAKTTEDLTHLFKQHRELRQETNTLHDPIIHRLPPEISSLIF